MGLKVALAGTDASTLPAWVAGEMSENGIDFVHRECTSKEELFELAGDADVIWLFGGSRVLTADALPQLPRCGCIIRSGAGVDNIPVDAATELGIVVANTPEAHHEEVAEHTVGLLLAAVRQIGLHDRVIRSGKWRTSDILPRCQVKGRTLGLVGFGRIARTTAAKLSGFELAVLAFDPHLDAATITAGGAESVELEELLARSDFVSLHCPRTSDTEHLISERQLRLMKPGAVLINTSRGAVVDERALIHALREGWISAAGLDVFEQEPPTPDNPLFELDNVVVTAHAAGFSDVSIDSAWRLSVDTAIDLSNGRWPRSYVNKDVKPRMELS